MNAVVIGSGLSGLTAAAVLAQAGHQVTVFEQYHRPGGVTAPFELEGFRWDLGQMLIEGLGPDEPLGLILAELGLAGKVRARVDDRGYVFPDFELKKPEQYLGVDWRMRRLKELFPGEEAALDRYWTDYVRFTRAMTLARRLERRRGWRAQLDKAGLFWHLLPLLPRRNWSARRMMDSYFRSDRLKLVFTSILADFFTSPDEFIGLGVFALNPEASFDRRMPRELAPGAEQLYHYSLLGGIGTWVAALVTKIESDGGRICTGRPVRRILVDGGRVTGVVDDSGVPTPAETVIASGGAKETFLGLVGEAHLPAEFAHRVQAVPLMDSVFMVHLGVDFDPSPYVHGVCTYYYGTYDIDRGIAEGRSGVYHEGRDGFVVHVPSLHSPEMAPAGHHAMTVYTICPDTLRDGDWDEQKEVLAARLIACAERHIPGLSQHIRVQAIITPQDWRARTHLDHHAFGGIAPVLGSWRVPHRTPLPGLWFVGAQSASGGGVNAVVPAAFKAAREIIAGGG